MTWQLAAQLAAATLLAFNVIGACALLYLRKPLYQPSRWWIGHVNNLIGMTCWVVLLTIGGFWS